MKKYVITSLLCFSALVAVAQSKITVGIVHFSSSYPHKQTYYTEGTPKDYVTPIEDAVTDAFLRTKRFSMVERSKMNDIRQEKELQKNQDFIDGKVIEQSKSVGAQYIVIGNVTKAEENENDIPVGGAVSVSQQVISTAVHVPIFAPSGASVKNRSCAIEFSIKVVDVTTGEIIASNSFNAKAKGKNAFSNALDNVAPQIETFIKDNFKVVVSVASVEEKNTDGEAEKILIAGGTNSDIKKGDKLKVFELTEVTVDDKKMTRKHPIGKVKVVKVEDENFSICQVLEGGKEIADKITAGTKIKCEVINE